MISVHDNSLIFKLDDINQLKYYHSDKIRWLDVTDDYDLIKEYFAVFNVDIESTEQNTMYFGINVNDYDGADLAKGKLCAYIGGNKILSFAGIEYTSGNEWEICAGSTHPNFSNKGYAKAVCSFAAKYILESGRQAICETNVNNIAAQRALKGVGMAVKSTARVIFLNGVTSAGKTSVARAIQEASSEIYYHVSNDMFHNMIGRKFWRENGRGCIARSIIAMYHAVRAMYDSGLNVIVDGMLLEMPEYREIFGQLNYDIMRSVFAGANIFVVELYCPLEECRRRNIARGDRGEFQSAEQHAEMNKNITYDFSVDSSLNTAEKCAELILEACIVKQL